MKKTSSKIFIFYLSIVFAIIIAVIINRIYLFQTTRIDLVSKSDIGKVIDGILQKNLSLKEAEYYQVIEENNSQ